MRRLFLAPIRGFPKTEKRFRVHCLSVCASVEMSEKVRNVLLTVLVLCRLCASRVFGGLTPRPPKWWGRTRALSGCKLVKSVAARALPTTGTHWRCCMLCVRLTERSAVSCSCTLWPVAPLPRDRGCTIEQLASLVTCCHWKGA